MIIDTHLHVWSADTDSYPFFGGRQPSSDGSVELLNKVMSAAAVDRAVIVQPIYYLYDNRYVAACLKAFPGRFSAIGLVDCQAPDAADQLERLVRQDGFSGLRIHTSRPDDPAEWAAADQDPVWERAGELGASFIVHGPAALLPALEPIIARFPEVAVALDHIGGAPTNEPEPRPLLGNVLKLARYPNVYIKFTPQGNKSEQGYPFTDTFPAFRLLYDAFGPQRLMWGTNFPGVINSLGYVRAVDMFNMHMDFLSDADKEWLFSRTALGIYNFGE